MDVNRVAAAGDTIVKSPALDDIGDLQRILPLDATAIPNPNLGTYRREGGSFKAWQITLHEIRNHKHLLSALDFTFGVPEAVVGQSVIFQAAPNKISCR
ncbi:hypothetical protein PA598K_03699 [Paenibacillus sp. 598K]|nr:hypothetical protein PA598K_03699 [Paenibacillus sp. 598K]